MSRNTRGELGRSGLGRVCGAGGRRSGAALFPLHRRLHVEALEDRRLLATITCNTLVDEFNGVGVGAGTSLRDAIFSAAPGDTIEFSVTGTINLTTLGEITINKSLSINGPGAELLIIRAHDPTPTNQNGDGSRIFNIDDGDFETDRNVSISGLTLTGADAISRGGAIYSDENLVLTAVTMSGNSAGEGGGVHNGGTLTILDSLITGNSAGRGGGVFSNGNSPDALTIIDSRISGNTAVTLESVPASGRGGGVYAQGDATIRGITLSGNWASDLGGGFLGGGYGGVSVTISETNISGNFAALGGGIFNFAGTFVKSSTIHANTATIGGGAIRSQGDLRVSDSTLSGNVAGSGSAISGVNLQIEVTRSTITGNHATSSSSFGGALSGSADRFVVRNSIVAANTSAAGIPDVRLSGDATQTFHFSVIGNNSGSNLEPAPVGSPDSRGNLIGTASNSINPLLGVLDNNGGPTFTHALLPGSPAIDAGDPDAASDEDDVPLYDQRGAPFHRVFDGNSNGSARIDIGAYELQPGGALGDYNRDGGVNAADYVMWRKLFGTSVAPPFVGADGDGDSSVDPGDYDVWTKHLGETLLGSGGAGTRAVGQQSGRAAEEETGRGGEGEMKSSRTVEQQSSREIEQFRIADFGLRIGVSQGSRIKDREPEFRSSAFNESRDRELAAWLDSRALERSRQTPAVDGDFSQKEACETGQEATSDDVDAVFDELFKRERGTGTICSADCAN